MPVVVVKYTPLELEQKQKLAKDITDIVAGQLQRDPKDITVCFEETPATSFAQGGVLSPLLQDRLMRVNIEWFDNKPQDVTEAIVKAITQRLHEVTGAPIAKIETGITLLAGRSAGVPYYVGGNKVELPLTPLQRAGQPRSPATGPAQS